VEVVVWVCSLETAVIEVEPELIMLFESPPYDAVTAPEDEGVYVTEHDPAVSVHESERKAPESLVQVTVPVGANPGTTALHEPGEPRTIGEGEQITDVLLWALVTVIRVMLELGRLFESPS